MSGQWRVLDFCDFMGVITHSRGRLIVRHSGSRSDTERSACKTQVSSAQVSPDTVEVPLVDIALILIGGKCLISTGTLHYCAFDYDVIVVHCDWKHVPIAVTCSTMQQSRIAARQLAQAAVKLPVKKRLWTRIVTAKILGQQANLAALGKHAASEKLTQIAKTVRSGDPDNREAQAARIYWGALFAEHNFRRDPESGDIFNSALNYAYTVLRGHGIRALHSAGLNPVIGLFHHGYYNPNNFADDLVEPFRPAIDYAIYQLQLDPHTSLTPDIKRQLVAATTQTFDSTGVRLSHVMEHTAQRLGNYMENPTDTSFECPQWRPLL